MTLEIALMIVGFLIVIVGIVSGITSIWLVIKYFRFNRKENSLGLTGIQIARKILDDNGLEHIRVKRTGSLLFGNSYSHYFKKVRLRGFIRHETSVTSIGMGAQKAALAILDKEGDEDMKKRIRLVPLVTFGPFAFIPLIRTTLRLPIRQESATISVPKRCATHPPTTVREKSAFIRQRASATLPDTCTSRASSSP
jgi:Zn-dependent membrane protease YugP